MSIKNKKQRKSQLSDHPSLSLSAIEGLLNEPEQKGKGSYVKRHWGKGAAGFFILLLCLGVLAKNGWLPRTDPMSGKRTGWFGKEIQKDAPSSWNPFAVSSPTPSLEPQLSKEYIYAGSRLLSVVDKNVNEIPPDDLAVWRPSNGYWYVKGGPGSAETGFQWGLSIDKPAQGDFDGDGKTDFCVYRPPPSGSSAYTWHINGSSSGAMSEVVFNLSGLNTPAVGDFDGDGKTDLAARQSAGNSWRIKYSSNGSTIDIPYGASDAKPVPADYDGDGKADLAVWRDSNNTFTWKSSFNGQEQPPISTGFMPGDKPVCADYDGDGKDDFAVFRPSDASWRIIKSSNSQMEAAWYGISTDTPVPNDYDGDGIVDIAVWRVAATLERNPPAYWYIRQSSKLGALDETRFENWGRGGDIPVPAFYRR
ncbi:MAG: FG-GAP repeat domain-containing protein [Pyrinomonadaceae bacterium]